MELSSDVWGKYQLILQEVGKLATPEKAATASITQVLDAIRDLQNQVRQISSELRSVRTNRSRILVNRGMKAAEEVVKALSKASHMVSRGGVRASWEAQEVLRREVDAQLESLLKDMRIVTALDRIPPDDNLLLLEGTVRTWQYNIEDDLRSDVQSLPYSEVTLKDSRIGFYEGGILAFITIISVAANIATLADILYRHFRSEERPDGVIRIQAKGRSIDIQMKNASVSQIREVLESCVESRRGRRRWFRS